MIRLGITLGIVGIAIVAALAWSSVAGDMALALMGHYLVFCGTVLVFYQIRLGVIVERRRATAEFLFGPLVNALVPLEAELMKLLKKPVFHFAETEPDYLTLLNTTGWPDQTRHDIREAVLRMLNFYERLGLLVAVGALDDVLVAEDKAATAVGFLRWTAAYRTQLRQLDPRMLGNTEALYERWDRKIKGEHKLLKKRERGTVGDKLAVKPSAELRD